jgi:hypothetical protein
MAKLGTKGRPAIVRVRTEARAKEVASVFNEHGWQFILGIEPDKPENIVDLTRLLKTEKSGQKSVSDKAKKPVPRRKSNAPLRVIQTRKEQTQALETDMKVTYEKSEYFLNTDSPKLYTIILGALSVFFLVKLLTSPSIWYLVFLVVPFFCFLSLLYALVLNQKIILHGNNVTILRRMQTPLTATVADSLHQITVKNGAMVHFRFRFHNGRQLAQISPSAYKNSEQLLKQLTDIIDQEKLVVDIIEK